MAADFLKTAELLASSGIYRPVPEIHGVLSGIVCTGSSNHDVELALRILELEDDVPQIINNLMQMLLADIRNQLKGGDYGFQPMLPDDDEPLASRISALADWCDGFIAGFAGAWVRDESSMMPETREVLADFSRIAQVDQDDEALSEKENEVNFMEIVEYARMAAITVYQQNAPAGLNVSDEEPGPEVIH